MTTSEMIQALSTEGLPAHWSLGLKKAKARAIAAKLQAAEELAKCVDRYIATMDPTSLDRCFKSLGAYVNAGNGMRFGDSGGASCGSKNTLSGTTEHPLLRPISS